nr:hypothetical protein [uncultured bacterium]
MGQEIETLMDNILDRDVRYKKDAYAFIMEALSYTQKKFKAHRHVTTEEILMGMKELLIMKYGPLAITVLEHWGIKTTEDFGNIIFNLVECRILSKTDEDKIETFRNAYDFEDVFKSGYRKQLAKKISRMKAI